MFDFYFNLVYSESLFSVIVKVITIGTAVTAIIIGCFNLINFKRSHVIQTHLNVIDLEKDFRRKRTEYKVAAFKYERASSVKRKKDYDPEFVDKLALEEEVCFESYVTAADKIASLLNTKEFKKQQNYES